MATRPSLQYKVIAISLLLLTCTFFLYLSIISFSSGPQVKPWPVIEDGMNRSQVFSILSQSRLDFSSDIDGNFIAEQGKVKWFVLSKQLLVIEFDRDDTVANIVHKERLVGP